MTSALSPETLRAVAATVRSLTAQATELDNHAAALRQDLAQLDERMRSLSDALRLIPRPSAPADAAAGERHPPRNPAQ
ncbi:hypothetical protein [Streptomyces sp. NPDC096132]|uniref:hypothetical protein n=1 Tax=Streptomyces sp. NPDC096132 TaxID=3366075 RepID=UPI0038085B69